MYTKEYFRQQLSDIISPIEKYYNGGKVQYARHSAWYENLSADVEAFARPLWGLVPFWAAAVKMKRLKSYIYRYNKRCG